MQSNIEIDDHHILAVMGKGGTQCGRGRSFANATFAGCHDQNFCLAYSFRPVIAEIVKVSPSSQAWMGWL